MGRRMKKRRKTEYGYINYQKIRQLFMTFLMTAIGIFIYFLGCALNKGENTNVFTIIAILMVLPGAKFFVNFVVLFPYHTPDKKQYEELKSCLQEKGVLYSDLVITSKEKVMNLDFLIIQSGCVLGVLGKKDQELPYIQKYLAQGVRNWASGYSVKIYKEYGEFKKGLGSLKPREAESSEKAEEYLRSLIV